MIQFFERHREAIDSICRRHHVATLEVFGSAAVDGSSSSKSDLDFLVSFRPTGEMNAADQYFGLLFDLQGLFERDIDLVCANVMKNRYFIEAVNQSRKPLYAA